VGRFLRHSVYTFSGALAPDGILPGATIAVYVQVLRSPVLEALLHGSPAAGAPKFAAWYKEWNYGTFAEGAIYVRPGGHHVGHRPTL